MGENGFYGKLPGLGDFVYRRLPRDFQDPWDAWLQGGISTSKELLGKEAWLETYLVGPVWRFILSENVCGPAAWAGVLIPSVDKVGRYFPLTIAAPIPVDTNPMRLAIEGKCWFDEAETVALDALERDVITLEEFDSQVSSIGSNCSPEIMTQQACDLSMASDQWQIGIDEPADLLEAQVDISWHLARRLMPQFSYWFSDGSENVPASILLTQGLPTPTGFTSLLNGDWSGTGWHSWLGFSPIKGLDNLYPQSEESF
ncbi:MAG: type VI secretion system-associated protein TagF [Sedimenticola sp.]